MPQTFPHNCCGFVLFDSNIKLPPLKLCKVSLGVQRGFQLGLVQTCTQPQARL